MTGACSSIRKPEQMNRFFQIIATLVFLQLVLEINGETGHQLTWANQFVTGGANAEDVGEAGVYAVFIQQILR